MAKTSASTKKPAIQGPEDSEANSRRQFLKKGAAGIALLAAGGTVVGAVKGAIDAVKDRIEYG